MAGRTVEGFRRNIVKMVREHTFIPAAKPGITRIIISFMYPILAPVTCKDFIIDATSFAE